MFVWGLAVMCAAVGAVTGWYAPTLTQRTTDLTIHTAMLIRVLVGVVGGLCVGWTTTPLVALPATVVFVVSGTVLFLIDAEHHRLPNRWTLYGAAAMASCYVVAGFTNGADGRSALIRAVVGAAVLACIYLLLVLIHPRGMGVGDAKLALSIGLILGWAGYAELLVGAFAAFIFASIVGIALIIAKRADLTSHIPFGPYMLTGSWTGLLVGQSVADWYLGLTIGG